MIKKLIIILIFLFVSFAKTGEITFEASGKADISGYTFNDNNSLIFQTRENKEKNFTEYYNLIYQYQNDCLTAGVEYNKEYYSDQDLKPSENLFFKISIIPFGGFNTPNLK